jgi:hypothetical protein
MGVLLLLQSDTDVQKIEKCNEMSPDHRSSAAERNVQNSRRKNKNLMHI